MPQMRKATGQDAQAHGSHFPAHEKFSTGSDSSCILEGHVKLQLQRLVSILNSGHLQMGQSDITSLKSDFYCSDSPCGSKIELEVEELSINM